MADTHLFLIIQKDNLKWEAWNEDIVCLGEFIGSTLARDAAIKDWERRHGERIPSEFEFTQVPYTMRY